MRFPKLVWLIIIAGLWVRLGWVLSRPTDDVSLRNLPDQVEYLEIARNILAGRGMGFYDPVLEQQVYAYRMPGYPLFIAVCGADIRVVRVVQAILDASLALGAFLLLQKCCKSTQANVHKSWQAIAASCLVSLNPYLIFFSSTILSETLFTVLLVWGMVLILQDRTWRFAAGVGLLIGSVYVRPGAIGLPVLLVLWAQFLRNPSDPRLFRKIITGLAMIMLMVVSLFPWALRNRFHPGVGAWVFTTTNTGITLYDGLNPLADGSSNQAGFRNRPELKSMTEVQRSDYLKSLAIQYAKKNPVRTMQLAWRKILRTWSPAPLSADFGANILYVLIGAGFTIPLFGLVVWGLLDPGVGRSVKLFLLIPSIYFTLVHAMTVGSLRYRIPSDVPMSVLAACGTGGLMLNRFRKTTPPQF